jgi:divalent metal cation (Fe/Co/Zn/Cd) transporter
MSSVPQISKQATLQRIQGIQTLTIVWMTVEAAVSLVAAWMAHSPALLAFGGDSAIELLSAIVVLWRFRAHADQEQSEKRAARIAGVLLFILAAYVAVVSALTLLEYSEPKTTYGGRRLGRRRRNHALACEGKAEAISNHGKRRTQSGWC